MSNHMHSKENDENTDLFANFNVYTVSVLEWIINSMLHFIMDLQWFWYIILFPHKRHSLLNNEAEITFLRLQFNLIQVFIPTEVIPLSYQRR